MARSPGSRARNYDEQPSTNRYGPKPVEPFSPWQLLVEERRIATGQPIRVVATRAQIPHGTFFNWVRAAKGVPPRTSYTQELNKRLAAALEVDEEQLAAAYNKSAFVPVDPKVADSPRPAPRLPQNDTAGLQRLVQMLRASGRTVFTLAEIELTVGLVQGAVSAPIVKSLDNPVSR